MNRSTVRRSDWDAAEFFRRLLQHNVLAQSRNFRFCMVSGLQGLEDMLHVMQDTANFLAVSDTSDGALSLGSSPRFRRVKTVFMAMRHVESDMTARMRCMHVMREVFRQMMSVLFKDGPRLGDEFVFVSNQVAFSEIDRYFFSGCACAYFQISVDVFSDLCVCSQDWDDLSAIGVRESECSCGYDDDEPIDF